MARSAPSGVKQWDSAITMASRFNILCAKGRPRHAPMNASHPSRPGSDRDARVLSSPSLAHGVLSVAFRHHHPAKELYSRAMRGVVVLPMLVAGCRFDLPKISADALGSANPDSNVARCDVTKPFGLPVPVDGVNTDITEGGGWLSEDQLTIYFARDPGGNANLYLAMRAQPKGAFAGAALLEGVNTSNHEAGPSLTADGLTMFLQANIGSSAFDIHVTTRTSSAAIFSMHAPVANINTVSNEGNPMISDNGLVLYFSSDRAGAFDIFKSTRANTGSSFNTPVAISELNTTTDDFTPVLSKDGLEIFFASKRVHSTVDIFHATRTTPDDTFGTPTLDAELSSEANYEFPHWISPDRCELIFESDRSGGSGNGDLWIAMRPK